MSQKKSDSSVKTSTAPVSLKEVKEIGIIRLGQSDVVRNKLVTKIIEAYENYDAKNKES